MIEASGLRALSCTSASGHLLLSLGEALELGDYRVHSRFNHATNFVGPNNRLASVVDEAVGAGPVNVVISGCGPWPWDAMRILQDCIILSHRQSTERLGPPPFRIADSLVRADAFDSAHLAVNLPLCERLLAEYSPPRSLAFLLDRGPIVPLRRAFDRTFAERARGAARHLRDWNVIGAVQQLRGCGYGLTPSGDDFACGVVSALDMLDRGAGARLGGTIVAACVAAIGENVLSNAFLDLASRGLLAASHKAWVEALGGGAPDAVAAATVRLLGVGATSGADFAAGFVLTCRAAQGRHLPAAP